MHPLVCVRSACTREAEDKLQYEHKRAQVRSARSTDLRAIDDGHKGGPGLDVATVGVPGAAMP